MKKISLPLSSTTDPECARVSAVKTMGFLRWQILRSLVGHCVDAFRWMRSIGCDDRDLVQPILCFLLECHGKQSVSPIYHVHWLR